MITFKNVSKFYNKGTFTALNDITFSVPEKSIYGIVGLSGAGKTTILKLIAGLEFAEKGTITVAGKEVCENFTEDYRDDMSIVFQGYNLLMQSSVFENIAFPLRARKKSERYIENHVRLIAEDLGIKDKLKEYPSRLSGGQKQRVALARAIVTNPRILLLDEPTSALDPITTKSLALLLRGLSDEYNLTIVLITHDLVFASDICDRMLVVSNGEIVKEGNVEEVMNSDIELIKELFRRNKK